MTTIGVISDTHIKPGGKRKIPTIVFETFENVDLILHAGDLNTMQVVHDLEALAPVYAVHGNNEDGTTVGQLYTAQCIEVEQCAIGLVHGDEFLPGGKPPRPLEYAPGNKQTAANALTYFQEDPDVKCIVFGHSHRPLIQMHRTLEREILLFNPGSASDRRREPLHSCGLLRVDGAEIQAELIKW